MNVLVKDFLRELKNSLARFLSILLIVALGCGFFAGIRASGSDMKNTLNVYFEETKFMDAQVISNYGLTQSDIDEIQKTPGVARVVPVYQTDLLAAGGEMVLRVHSLASDINQVVLTSGRMPENPGECLVEDPGKSELVIGKQELVLGNTLHLTTGAQDTQVSQYLKSDEYKIVGTIQSPLYLSMHKPSSLIGAGMVNYYMMVPPEEFTMEVYAAGWIQRERPTFDTYAQEYKQWGRETTTHLEALAEQREPIRMQEVTGEPQQKIDDGQRELDEAKTKGERELADARGKIASGERELADARASYEQGVADYESGLRTGAQKLQESKQQLESGEAEYRKGLDAYYQALARWQPAKEQLEQGLVQLKQQQGLLDQSKQQLLALQGVQNLLSDILTNGSSYTLAQVNAAVAQVTLYDPALGATAQTFLDNVTLALPSGAEQAVILGEISGIQGSLDAGWSLWRSGQEEVTRQTGLLQSEIRKNDGALQAALGQLQSSRALLDSGWSAYRQGAADFEKGKVTGAQKLSQGQAGLQAAEQAMADAKAKLTQGESELQQKTADAQTELDDAKKKLAELRPAQWTVESRDKMADVAAYESNAKRIDSIANVFPAFFVLIAGLVCLTTMTRMVEDQRLQVGTLKAMGYSNAAIAGKYVMYAFCASLLGSVLGLWAGFQTFPRVVFGAYSAMLYRMPPIRLAGHPLLGALTTLVAVGVTTLTTLTVIIGVLRAQAAQLMRPQAPRAGKRIFLERIKGIWDKLSFSYKVTARNVFRYKKRMLMSLIGIAGCTALMLSGFGVKDAIADIVPIQFSDIFHYDLNIILDERETEPGDARSLLEGKAEVQEYMLYRGENGSIDFESKKEEVTLVVSDQTKQIQQFVTLRTKDKKPLELGGDGVIITQKLADTYDLHEGSTISLTAAGIQTQARVAGVTENYVFHFVYMSDAFYEREFHQPPEYNRAFARLEERVSKDAKASSRVTGELVDSDEVLTVLVMMDTNNMMKNQMKSLDTVIYVLIISAGLLAFVVMYNLTNINIIERQREIATLKVLGFFEKETNAYVFRENIILSMLGSLLGLVLGIFMTRFVTRSAEVDAIMFIQRIKAISYVYAFVLTMSFTLIVRFMMMFRLRKIDMIESLKSVE